MLISFKSKSSPEVLMYQEHAQRILDILHKNPTRGVITPTEAGDALALLEKEVAESKLHPETTSSTIHIRRKRWKMAKRAPMRARKKCIFRSAPIP